VLLAVLGFGSSALPWHAAYGIAVTVTMLITTLLTFFVVRQWLALPAAGGAGCDRGVSGAGPAAGRVVLAIKFFQGGWFPLVLGGGHLCGHGHLAAWPGDADRQHTSATTPSLLPFIHCPVRRPSCTGLPRTAVYAVANPGTVPQALMHNLKHNADAARAQCHPDGGVSRGTLDTVCPPGAGAIPLVVRFLEGADELWISKTPAGYSQGRWKLCKDKRAYPSTCSKLHTS
jgi:K+ transporter